MISLSVSEFCTKRWSFFQDVLQTTTRGFEGIGIWQAKAEDEGIREAIELVHEMQIKVSSLSWVGGFTGFDGTSHKQAIKEGLETIHLARQLEAECVVVHVGGQNNHTDNHARRIVRNAMDELVESANHLGIRLAIEPMRGYQAYKWNFFQSFDDALELASHYPCEDVGIVLDLYHWGDDMSVFSKLPSFMNRVALVQVADRLSRNFFFDDENRRVPGNGSLPIYSWLERLDHFGYNGFCELEVHGYEVAHLDYAQILTQSRSALTHLLSRVTDRSEIHPHSVVGKATRSIR